MSNAISTWHLIEAARRGAREAERRGRSSPTADFCPTCKRATIHLSGGEWCRWCRGWIEELVIYQGTDRPAARIRVLGSYRL